MFFLLLFFSTLIHRRVPCFSSLKDLIEYSSSFIFLFGMKTLTCYKLGSEGILILTKYEKKIENFVYNHFIHKILILNLASYSDQNLNVGFKRYGCLLLAQLREIFGIWEFITSVMLYCATPRIIHLIMLKFV